MSSFPLLSNRVRQLLQELCHEPCLGGHIIRRAQIILYRDLGWPHRAIARELSIQPVTVGTWVKRWQAHLQDGFLEPEQGHAPDLDLRRKIVKILSNAPSGPKKSPIRYTDKQIAAIMAIASEPPQASGREIAHWTMATLADEAVRRGIVPYISASKLSVEIQNRLEESSRDLGDS